MSSASKNLAEDYERIRSRSKEDPGTAGDRMEEAWKRFLGGWLPGNYHVVTKGRLLGADGKSSPQMDILVLHPSYPKALLDEKYYFAGGVIAAFEVKSQLRVDHVREFFSRTADVKGLQLSRGGSPYDELFQLPLVGLLAATARWDKKAELPLLECIQGLEDKCDHPRLLPDLLAVADRECVVREIMIATPESADSADEHADMSFVPEILEAFPRGGIGVTYMSYAARLGDTLLDGNVLSSLVAKLTTLIAMDDIALRPLASYLSEIDSTAIGRPWFVDAQCLSRHLRSRLKMQGFDRTPWSRWAARLPRGA